MDNWNMQLFTNCESGSSYSTLPCVKGRVSASFWRTHFAPVCSFFLISRGEVIRGDSRRSGELR
jgi:hypothetical protein